MDKHLEKIKKNLLSLEKSLEDLEKLEITPRIERFMSTVKRTIERIKEHIKENDK